ncbi:MAG: SH3 domain-containing protein [Spirochaetales bacterium]|nr:SH3 domain-containing protein [Spirochaetales bacterium]
MRKTGIPAVFCIIAACTILFSASSCENYRGYGVLLVENEALPVSVGDILNISTVFNVDNYYEVELNEDLVNIPMWQIEFFNSRSEAEKFTKAYEPFYNTYVFTKKYGYLPMRAEPNSTSNMIYKIKAGQIFKVIGRDAEPIQVGNLSAYWYHLLSGDGVKGYAYGYHLEEITGKADLDARISAMLEDDPNLDKLLGNVWRPLEVERMIATGKIDMTIMEKNYALTPKPDQNIISVSNEDFTQDFIYTEIKKLSGDTYSFEGADLKIQVLIDDKVRVSYHHNNVFVTREFVLVDKDVEGIVKNEKDRRQNLLLAFVNKGGIISSSSYGTITLDADARFTWDNFTALKNIAIPPDASGSGRVNFNAAISRRVEGAYTGTITFVFDNVPSLPVTFLYTMNAESVKFIHVPQSNIKDNEIRQLGPAPLVIVFNF